MTALASDLKQPEIFTAIEPLAGRALRSSRSVAATGGRTLRGYSPISYR